MEVGMNIMKRAKDVIVDFASKVGKRGEKCYGIKINNSQSCVNCKHYQKFGDHGIAGFCTHEKAIHYHISDNLDTYGKPTRKAYFLAVMPHFKCGMRAFEAK
jgi:hypothetical protein